MDGTPPTVTLTTPFVPNPTCYQTGHLSQISDFSACYTEQGAVTCQRATYGPGYDQEDTPNTGCFPDKTKTALTECPADHTVARRAFHIYTRWSGTGYATATVQYCCPTEFDFFVNPTSKIPRLQPDGSIKWSEIMARDRDQGLCFATSVKQFSGTDHPVTVTHAQMPAIWDLSPAEQDEVTDGQNYESRLRNSAKVVTAAWDYHNGVLVAQPQEVFNYVHGDVTYWGYYYYHNRFSANDLPASRTGVAAMGTPTATATATTTATAEGLVKGPNEKDGDGSIASATSSETVPSSSSTSAGHQSLKLSGIMLCASVMCSLGLFLST
ncbi:hypothetical protein B0T09DRAFT_84828 [Sordaria sp. MPI-SDFR-AT-0083]|nr:hypothetical protein B0T09DRAFT_84828 [Sordaria sp. MPI-SDFR-AT-0083]